MMNFIGFILCMIAAVIHLYQGNIGWVIFQVALASLNLLIVFKRLKKSILKNVNKDT